MNKHILELIKEAVNSEKQEKSVERLYRIFWIYILDRFKQEPKNALISIVIMQKDNNYYNLLSYGDNKLTELFLKIPKEEKEPFFKMLSEDGFNITKSNISISRQKIIDFATKEERQRKIVAVPEIPINMIDEMKIKSYH